MTGEKLSVRRLTEMNVSQMSSFFVTHSPQQPSRIDTSSGVSLYCMLVMCAFSNMNCMANNQQLLIKSSRYRITTVVHCTHFNPSTENKHFPNKVSHLIPKQYFYYHPTGFNPIQHESIYLEKFRQDFFSSRFKI